MIDDENLDPIPHGIAGPRAIFARVHSARDGVSMVAATFFGLGLAPVAPGTFGTLGGVAVAWSLHGADPYLVWVLVAAVALYVVGRLAAHWAERAAGKDPGFYVIDEVIGYLITIAWTGPPTLLTLLVGFVVFRFFDILKPPPVKRFERIPGGDGILLDDVVAGFYGFLVMAALRTFLLDPGDWILGAGA